MKTILNRSILLMLLACFGFRATAQITISSTSLPDLVGEYNLTYARTNTDISALIGTTGSNYWDFSQPQSPDDVVGRMDIVPVSDMGYGANFPGATFAERYDGGAVQGMSWEYYDVDATNGLVFYGIYYPTENPSYPAIPITPPTSVLPPSLYYGESWTNGYEYVVEDPIFGGVLVTYQASASVDAYGTLRLPGFGEVPALRITVIENTLEEGVSFQADTNWQWLAPGIGYAAQAVSYSPNAIDALTQPFTNSFDRSFLYPDLAPPPTARLTVQSNIASLEWQITSNASGYVVQTSTNLNITNWLPVAQLTNLTISVATVQGAGAQFFRVIAQP